MKQFALTIPNPQGTPEPLVGPTEMPIGGLGLGGTGTNIIQVGINLLFVLGIILAIIFLAYSGIQWATSGGDKQRLQAARKRLIYSIIGLIVITASFGAIMPVIDSPNLWARLVLILLIPF